MLRPNIILSVFIIFSKFQAALCFRPAAQFVAEGVPANRSINQCVFKTKPSASNIDEISLILEDPNFTFFDSREFYLSWHPSCDPLHDVDLRKAPSTTEAKRTEQERRFKVKQIKEGLNALKKQEIHYMKDLAQQFQSKDFKELPAVELHMFPEDPLDVGSRWLVLLVPKARKLFGKTMYLCRPKRIAQHSEGNSMEMSPCVAELTFAALPTRFINLFNEWEPSLDPLKSVPHHFVFALEILLVASLLLTSSQAILKLLKLLLVFLKSDNDPAQQADELLLEQTPKFCKLAHFAHVYTEIGDATSSSGHLDAGLEVTVLEMKSSEGNITGSLPERIIKYAKMCVFRTGHQAVWGRLCHPVGWILLYDSANPAWKGFLDASDKPPFRANRQLMIPIGELIRRQLVLATSHVTVQWFLLDTLAGYVQVKAFIIIVSSFFCLHVLVLLQSKLTLLWGLRCDQILEKERKRLHPPTSQIFKYFLLLLLLMMSAVLVGVTASMSASTLAPCFALIGAVILHAFDLHLSLQGLSNWKKPQLCCEFTEYHGEKLLQTDVKPETLTKEREKHYLMASLLTWLMITAGLSVLILMGLDGLKMRGALTDYSFNKGYVTCVPGATALQNTILVHEDADSITFGYEAGPHTDTVKLKLQHPQLGIREASEVLLFSHHSPEGQDVAGVATAKEYQLNLPAGPFYSQITVKAASKLKIPSTRYTFHVIRVGQSISLSLTGKIGRNESGENSNAMATDVVFRENRRWLYQLEHVEWYIPQLDMNSNSSLELEVRPICFAPLQKAVSGQTWPHLAYYGNTCFCGVSTVGFGTECSMQYMINVGNSSLCIFLRETSDKLKIDDSRGSVEGRGSGLMTWFQDVRGSGRMASLRINSNLQLQERPFAADKVMVNQISTVYRVSMPIDLLMQSSQLVVATTPDDTDAEEQAVPLRVVPHPPPIYLVAREGFLLPDFNVNTKRNEYIACLPGLDVVDGVLPDSRFHIETVQVELGKDCAEHAITQKRFRAVRNQSCNYWDRYQPWNENYDIAVTLSPSLCLNEAIDLGNVSAVQKLSEWSRSLATIHPKSCPMVQRAVRLGRVGMIRELLNRWDPNCAGCAQTPLGVAAAEGKMDALDVLLGADGIHVDVLDANGGSALFRAVQGCNVAAVERLIQKKCNVNLSKRHESSQCQVTPLLWLAGYGHGACKEEKSDLSTNRKLERLFNQLVEAGASLSIQAEEGCEKQTALMEAIDRLNLPLVALLLSAGADPDEEGLRRGEDEMSWPLMALLHQYGLGRLTWSNFSDHAQLLLDRGAAINKTDEFGSTVLIEAAMRCQPDVVKFVLKNAADPKAILEVKDDENRKTAEDYSHECQGNQTARNETLRLLQQKRI